MYLRFVRALARFVIGLAWPFIRAFRTELRTRIAALDARGPYGALSDDAERVDVEQRERFQQLLDEERALFLSRDVD